MRLHLVSFLLLAACGGAHVEGTLRDATSAETARALTVLRATHGESTRVLDARALAGRLVVVYAHDGTTPAPSAASRMCHATAVAQLVTDGCTGAAIGLARLAPDGTTLDGDYGVGCADGDHPSIAIAGGDLDGDGRVELSLEVAQRAAFVVDVERFDVELAAWDGGMMFEHPDGTGLQTVFCRVYGEEEFVLRRRAASPWTEPPSESFDFDDLPEGCDVSIIPYDAEGDCWRYGLSS